MTAAAASSATSSVVDGPQAVTFAVGDLRLALEVGCVREIVRGVTPVPVPHAPADVAGIIDWRGRLIPLIDLRTRFGLAEPGPREHARVVVVESGTRVFGLAVDKIHTIVRFDPNDVRVPASAPATAIAVLPDVRAIEGTDLILLNAAMFASAPALN